MLGIELTVVVLRTPLVSWFQDGVTGSVQNKEGGRARPLDYREYLIRAQHRASKSSVSSCVLKLQAKNSLPSAPQG